MEYGQQVNQILEKIEDDADSNLSDIELRVVEIVEAVTIIESEGLHELWKSSIDVDLATKYIDDIGAHEIADLIQSGQWCLSAPDDRSDYSDTEENHLREIEEELENKLEEVVDLLEDFLEE